jgi:UDP-N-acetylmuramate dehydrogenase
VRIEDPKLVAALAEMGVELRPRTALSAETHLGIGGTTDLLSIHRHESIPDLINLLDGNHLPHRFLGGGSNLLVQDGELPWLVLQLARTEPEVSLEGNFAQIDAAADLGRTVTYCAKNDLGGLEGLIGVPGTVGGALRMNAGAYGTPPSANWKSSGANKFRLNTGTLLLRLMI